MVIPRSFDDVIHATRSYPRPSRVPVSSRGGPRQRGNLDQHVSVARRRAVLLSQQKHDIRPILVECWSSVCNAGPTFNQHWDDISD